MATQQLSMFEVARQQASDALRFSNEWLVHPVITGRSYAERLLELATGGDMSLIDQAQLQQYFCQGMICGRWAMSGFPTVTMGHRTAAALMATRIKPDDAVEFVKIPWPAFVIRLPQGILTIDRDGQFYEADTVLVTALEPEHITLPLNPHSMYAASPNTRWFYMMMAQTPGKRPTWAVPQIQMFFNGISMWGFNMPLESFADHGFECAVEGEDYERWDTHAPLDSDKRSEQLVRQLIVGACLHLAGDPRERAMFNKLSGTEIKERKSKKREGDEWPQYTEFEVRSSIKINLHHAMREYVERGGSSPTVQTMVAGHWKRVPFGVGRSQRRLQHIHPYWRGDVNAPISARVK